MKTQTTDKEIGLDVALLFGGAAAGALLMYMLDPDRGGARRAQSAAAVRNAGSRTTSALGNVWQGAGDMLDDTLAKAKRIAGRGGDAAADVAARAGSAASQAGDSAGELASQVTSRARQAGKDAADAAGKAYDAGERMRAGVHDTLHDTVKPGDWRAAARNPAVVGGGLLGLYGLARRSPLGLVLGLAGAALLARGVSGQPLRSLLSARKLGDRLSHGLHPTIDFEKTIHIDAAPEAVYDLWNNYENFPRFMSHVVEVSDLGRRRSHWVVKGPGGAEFAWNSVLTEQSRPQRLAWRSEPGAEIPQSGSVQFEAQGGGTLVTVRMSYTPPAGVIGHGLATVLGADPKTQMDDDLARMKAFIERGDLPRDAAKPRLLSRFLH